MEMRSSDVSPSFLQPYDHSSVNPFPLPRHPGHKQEIALGNLFISCLNPISAIPGAPEAFLSFLALSPSGQEMIPDFGIMESQAGNEMEQEAATGGTRTLGVLLAADFANEGRDKFSALQHPHSDPSESTLWLC